MLAIVGGVVHTVSHGILAGHSVLVRDDRIEAIVPDGDAPEGCEIIDASGHVVLPGLIDARTSVGLYGDGSGFQNADHEELTDPDVAWMRAIDALNPADPALQDARQAGVTTLLSGPGTTNVAGGLSAVIKTAGDTLSQILVRFPAGLQIGLGRPPVEAHRDKNRLWTRMGIAALLRERLLAARTYLDKMERAAPGPPQGQDAGPVTGAGAASQERNLRLEAYAGLLRREYPARVRVATAADAWTALRIADEFGLDLVLEQLTEGHLAGLPEELARRGVRCVVGPMMKAGKNPETKALTFQTAVVLAQAGIPLALCTGHPSRPIWTLRLEMALAVRAGLAEATALRAVTLNAAAALGLEDRLGSVEPGKQADLVILDGDPFLATSSVTHTIVGGQIVYGA